MNDLKKLITIIGVHDEFANTYINVTLKKVVEFDFNISNFSSHIDIITAFSEKKIDIIIIDEQFLKSLTDENLVVFKEKIKKSLTIFIHDSDSFMQHECKESISLCTTIEKFDVKDIEWIARYLLEKKALEYQKKLYDITQEESKRRLQSLLNARNKSYEKLKIETEQNRLLSQAIEQSVESFVITDPQGAIIYVNKAFEEISGYSKEEAIGKNPKVLKSGLHDNQFYKEMWETITSGDVWSGRLKNKRKDGVVFQEDARISAMRDEEGNIVNFLAVKDDVTKQINLEMQLVQSQKLESIGQLAAGIAHEINTPSQFVGDNIRFLQESTTGLFKLLDAFEDLKQTVKDVEGVQEIIEKIEELKDDLDFEFLTEETPSAIAQSLDGIQRISSIVLAMKDFSHPSTEDMTPANLNKMLDSTITIARNEWKYVAEIETVFDNNLPLTPCYIGEMNQVFLNIIVNAAHAIGYKNLSEKGNIKISTFNEEHHALITIEDNGTGIPQKIIEKIYDPFFTTKEVGKGTGQGLAIAYSTITEKHHGKIDVFSEEGKGTRFEIRIPLISKNERISIV
ncbi:MAG: PAS domain S-box protein [Deltaproteobacteria bacterium]|nr:PAS domain S-box protein [Deltaproteobacteria bacterium]